MPPLTLLTSTIWPGGSFPVQWKVSGLLIPNIMDTGIRIASNRANRMCSSLDYYVTTENGTSSLTSQDGHRIYPRSPARRQVRGCDRDACQKTGDPEKC